MMFVAIYVHLHLDVPAEILPIESKPPILAIGYLVLVTLNFYLYRKQALWKYIRAFDVYAAFIKINWNKSIVNLNRMNNFGRLIFKLKIEVIKLQLWVLKFVRNNIEKNYIKNGIKK